MSRKRKYPRVFAIVAMLPLLLAASSCARSMRVSGGALERLRRGGEHFVLVFGSLSIPEGKLDHPTIRFVHPGNPGLPDTLLWATTIATGERFYAVLHPPAGAEYLDAVHVEVGNEATGFDRIIYARMRADEEPLAMYVGEIEVRPAPDRNAQGQKVAVQTRDDFQNAQRELRRFYPLFEGPIVSTIGARSAAPPRQ